MGNNSVISKQLTAINLKYGTTSKSLKVLSFANLVAKAIHTAEKPLILKEIIQNVAEILEIRSIDQGLIVEAIQELKDKGDIYETNKKKWNLSKGASKKITDGTKEISDLIDRVLARHFPQNIDSDKIFAWFNTAATDFFGYNGEEWVKSVCLSPTKNPKVKTTDELLKRSIGAHSLTIHSQALIDGFQGFLGSSDKDDQRALMHFGFAMFSAKLVSADVGVDPITLDYLKDATFIIDTNFLFPLQLEASRYTNSFSALGKALKEINTKVIYINETKQEYLRVLSGKRGSVLKLVQDYPLEVTIDAKDQFVATAKKRACQKLSDFETFFDELRNLPKEIPDGPPLEFLDDNAIEQTVIKAKKDKRLKDSIQAWCIKMRPHWDKRPKSEAALNHDSSLIYVQENESKNRSKIYVLTLDRSLQVCATERVGVHSMPSVIYLEGLIQVLAANSSGPNADITNYAPLLSTILLKRCAPPEDIYTLEDLHWLYGIQKNVAKFEPEKIKRIVLAVAKARLAGKKADDRTLRRMVDRFYQEEIKEVGRTINEAEEKALQAQVEAEQERTLRKEKDEQLSVYKTKEARIRLRNSLFLQLLWRVPTTIFISVVVFYFTSLILGTKNNEAMNGFIVSNLDTFLALLSLFAFGWKLLSKPISVYFEKVKAL